MAMPGQRAKLNSISPLRVASILVVAFDLGGRPSPSIARAIAPVFVDRVEHGEEVLRRNAPMDVMT